MGAAVYPQALTTCYAFRARPLPLRSDAAGMRGLGPVSRAPPLRQEPQLSILIRYAPSGIHYARVRDNGKRIRKPCFKGM